MNISFFSWEEHRRTTEICRYFNIPNVCITSPYRGLRRYLNLIPRTLAEFSIRRSSVVIVQNPSLVLALLAALVKRWYSIRVVMDAHNEAVIPYLNPSRAIKWITFWLHRHVDKVIVTNRQLAETISANGGHPIVLPDRLPHPPEGQDTASLSPAFNVVFISTFARDEPIASFIEAARMLGDSCHFYVTGNAAKLPATERSAAPANVSFTGFLPEENYWALLRTADLVVDLTLIDNCLVCGAYEAISVGTPLVLSANAASIELFDGAAVFTSESAESIASAIRQARSELQHIRKQLLAARERISASWQHQATVAQEELRQLSSATQS